MHPGASVCGIYFAHPEASYYNVGNFQRDQIEDYAARKNMPVAEVERWLADRLAYESAERGEQRAAVEQAA
jgi:5-methyltetrahydrofolate--homocysteine methyltransferase